MTDKELVKLLDFIANSYPKKFNFPKQTKEATSSLIATWKTFLGGYDIRLAFPALKKLIVNEPDWPPTVGQVVRAIEEVKAPEQDKFTAGEAWKAVLRAIHIHGCAYGTEKAMNSLPGKVRAAVQCVGGLYVIGMSDETQTYMMNQFVKAYNELSDKCDRQERLPKGIRQETKRLAEKFKDVRPAIEGQIGGKK
jgi:hypothetical protein